MNSKQQILKQYKSEIKNTNALSDAEARRIVEDFFGGDIKEGLKPLKEGYDFSIRTFLRKIASNKEE